MASSPGAIPRPRTLEKRDSVLRASIFDTAQELGIGSSRTVTHWVFNPIGEVDEEAESTVSPSLTYTSTATSDDSWFSQSFSLNRMASDASSGAAPSLSKPVSFDEPSSTSQRAVQFKTGANRPPESPAEDQRVAAKQRKLRKTKQDGGYESDGGYVSDVTSKEKKKKSKKKADDHATGEESDGGYLSEVLARRRRRKKEKKEREQRGPTDDETDGYISSSVSKKEKKTKKVATAGEESDGGNLSEASSKRKLFGFRIKSRRRQDSSDVSLHDVIPPVPSLPTVSLPIAEKFSLSLTDLQSSRASTPAFSERTSTQRSSDETADVSFLDPTSSRIPSPLPSPNLSIRGLTSAFNDAQSVRTPSTDVLRAFGRQALAGTPRSPLAASNPALPSHTTELSSIPSSFSTPSLDMPKPKRNSSLKKASTEIRPSGNGPLFIRTQLTADPRASIPMMLTPPTPTPGVQPLRLVSKPPKPATDLGPASPLPTTPPSSSFHSAASSPQANTPSEYANLSPTSPPGAGFATGFGTQFAVRSVALGKYDLPPPSPPPNGPLPRVPTEDATLDLPRSPRSSRRPSTAENDNSSGLRVLVPTAFGTRSVRPLTAPGHSPPVAVGPRSPSRLGTTTISPVAQTTSSPLLPPSPLSPSPPSPIPGTDGGPPLFLQRIPSRQRGRESPFPTQPILSRETSQTSLAASFSTMSVSNPPQLPHLMSAGMLVEDAGRNGPPRLDINWQPRSASVLDDRQSETRLSWASVDEPRISSSTRNSTSSSQRDVDSVLSALVGANDEHIRDITELYMNRHGSVDETDVDDDDKSRYPDDEVDNRYSVFNGSDEPSRLSILDKERSSNVRQQFLKRVEEMYSKDGIERGMAPPVPKLPPSSPLRR